MKVAPFSQWPRLPRDALCLRSVPSGTERGHKASALATCAEGSGHCQGRSELEESPVRVEGTNKSEPK